MVVDEAHEVFSGIYKRYGTDGLYDQDPQQAQTAGRLREVMKRSGAPVVLLTATPIQNSLAELSPEEPALYVERWESTAIDHEDARFNAPQLQTVLQSQMR